MVDKRIVVTNSTNTFKRRLDMYWQDQLCTIFVHSYRQPEVVVIYLDMAKMTILVMLKCEMRRT